MTRKVDLGNALVEIGETVILGHGDIEFDPAGRIRIGRAWVNAEEGEQSRKFFLNFDQNALETATIKTNIATYETYPFDGMKMTLNLDPHPLYGAPASPNLCGLGDSYWTSTSLPWPAWAGGLSNVLTTNFVKFQHNYLELKIHPSTSLGNPPCDFFNPAFESGVIHNTRMAARFAKEGKLRGLWFDPEPLGGAPAGWSIWKYSDRPYASTRTFEEYKARAFYFGRRWMEVVQEEFPEIEIQVAFLYGFATEGETSTYGLLGSFLDGMFRARRGEAKIYEWGEEMYNRYQQNFLEFFKNATYLEHPTFSDSDYVRARAGVAIRMDDTPFDGDNALFQTGAENQHDYGTERYVSFYQETRRFLAGTATAGEVAAVRAARVSKGLEATFDPTVIPGLVAYLNPEALGLANGATMASFVDVTGNTWTGVGSPTYTSTGVGGHGGIDFVAASSQYATCHPVASRFSGTDPSFTLIWVQDFGTTPSGTVCMFSLGNSSDADPRISIRYTSAPLLTSQRVANDGTSDIAFASVGTYTPTTAATICAIVCNGALGSALVINGATNGYDPQPTIGAQTFDRMTLGALLQNTTPSQYFDDPVGSFLAFNRALGIQELKFVMQGIGRQYGITVV